MDNYLFSVIGSVLLFLIITPLYLYLKKGNHHGIALTIKGLGTFIPLLICMVATIQLNEKASLQSASAKLLPQASNWLLAGLLLCLLGDIVLGINFFGGMGAFLLGHFCYITAFCKLAPLQLWSIVLFIMLLFLAYTRVYPLIPKTNNNTHPNRLMQNIDVQDTNRLMQNIDVQDTNLLMSNKGDVRRARHAIINKLPYMIYGTVILAMVSIALLLPFSIGQPGVLPAIGASLFVFSDLLLARNMFLKVTPLSDAISLYSYYAGQFVLAMSVYLFQLFI
jgi:uncharacterized membrane protein YhhN